jgi:phosphopantetheinyl transferase
MIIQDFSNLYNNIKKDLTFFGIIPLSTIIKNSSLNLNFLTKDEQIIFNRYKQKKSKMEFLGGRVLLKYCLIRALKKENYEINDFTDLNIVKNNDGSPCLYIHKKLPNLSINFSISHKSDYIFCAVDTKHKLGIDVEKVNKNIIKIKSQFVSDNEEKIIEKASKQENTSYLQHLIKIWTAKEASIKCYGVNSLFSALADIELIDIKDNKYYLSYEVNEKKVTCQAITYLYTNYAFAYVIDKAI